MFLPAHLSTARIHRLTLRPRLPASPLPKIMQRSLRGSYLAERDY